MFFNKGLLNRKTLRYLDTVVPRLHSLLLITFSGFRFGLEEVGRVGWSLTVIGLAYSIVPDNSSFYFVSRKITKRLDSVILSFLCVKALVITFILFIYFAFIGDWLLGLVTLLVGCVEFLYGVVSTRNYSMNSMSKQFIVSCFGRLVGIVLCLIYAQFLNSRIDIFYFVSYLFVFISLFYYFRPWTHISFRVALRQIRDFSFSSQFSSFSTNLLLSLPLVLSPYFSQSPGFSGLIVLVNRYLGFFLQPIQIIQSFAIREFVEKKVASAVYEYIFFAFFCITIFVFLFVYCVYDSPNLWYVLIAYLPLAISFLFRGKLIILVANKKTNGLLFYNISSLLISIVGVVLFSNIQGEYWVLGSGIGWFVLIYGWLVSSRPLIKHQGRS